MDRPIVHHEIDPETGMMVEAGKEKHTPNDGLFRRVALLLVLASAPVIGLAYVLILPIAVLAVIVTLDITRLLYKRFA